MRETIFARSYKHLGFRHLKLKFYSPSFTLYMPLICLLFSPGVGKLLNKVYNMYTAT